MPRNLIVVRAGDKSLHPQWLGNAPRNWDLAVSYFGDHPQRYLDQYDFLHRCKGSKWAGLSDFVNRHAELIDRYDYLWFPDDDLFTTGEVINDFFNVCARLDLTIAQPALTRYSHYSWGITLAQPGVDFRLTDFVEIMAPCFKRSHFHLFRDTFSLNQSGWGLEWLWREIAQEHQVFRFGIVDKTPIFHTRKVGTAAHGGSESSPTLELESLLSRFQLSMTTPQVLQAGRFQGAN